MTLKRNCQKDAESVGMTFGTNFEGRGKRRNDVRKKLSERRGKRRNNVRKKLSEEREKRRKELSERREKHRNDHC